MKYRKHAEDKEVSDTFRYLDGYGREIPGAIEWDSDTGYATVYELSNLSDARSPVVQKQKYFPGGRVEIDNIANPDEEHLQKIRERIRKKETT